jgi:hypothetical protein
MGAPPSGVSPGFLFSDVAYPSYRESSTKFTINRSDIVVLGPVTATGESQCILALWSQGDNGYGNLMKAARETYPDADGVVDVQWDTKYGNLCLPCCYVWVPIFYKVKSTGEGQAFKFKK